MYRLYLSKYPLNCERHKIQLWHFQILIVLKSSLQNLERFPLPARFGDDHLSAQLMELAPELSVFHLDFNVFVLVLCGGHVTSGGAWIQLFVVWMVMAHQIAAILLV